MPNDLVRSIDRCEKNRNKERLYLSTKEGGNWYLDADIQIADEFLQCYDELWKNKEYEKLSYCEDFVRDR